jgi:glutamate N-acetyltransferase/amino-acid N-acetyltransferase
MSQEIVVPGFRWAGFEAGIRKRPGRMDLALLVADATATAAAVFTKSDACAAPVRLSRVVASAGKARAVLMNAGCANACTGEQGEAAAKRMAAALALPLGISADEVLIASTGVIGAQLPIEKVEAGTPALAARLSPGGIHDFAHAIMTTDTREKVASRTGLVGGKTVTVAGVCKGAGMIMPDMATMLACVATDADVSAGALTEILKACAEDSFNAVTVDGDTSTNDTLYLLASGQAGNPHIDEAAGPAFEALRALVYETCLELAKKIAADGEGATKFVEVRVEGAKDKHEADVIARRIANSPLVKTAWHAADANWGRIIAAAGACGFDLDATRIGISVDGAALVRNGVGLGAAAEEAAQQEMRKESFTVVVTLGRGAEKKSVFTCDFSADYVKINAEYRT